jgi:D-alanyl-D-alanine carboxypeptidase
MANRLGLATLVMAITAVLFVAAPPEAQANPRYAAYVVHADTGDVLFDRYSNDRRYPASLTKMMTLYLLFEEIEAGELALDDQIKVSPRATLP